MCREHSNSALSLTLPLVGRFIPACAGNTPKKPICCSCCSVHPRVCREHETDLGMAVWIHGSSPRVQGTQFSYAPVFCRPHFTGSSPRVQGTRPGHASIVLMLRSPVHPRVCREHDSGSLSNAGPIGGSSPRVQGTLHRVPASCQSSRYWVHPRVCREHICLISTQGTVVNVRFIPACAGNTIWYLLTGLGHYRRFIPACAGNTLPGNVTEPRCHHRFIPACAGNTRRLGNTGRAVHTIGSSPRVQGTRLFGGNLFRA